MTRDMTTLAATPMTAEELARLSVPGKSFDLVRGQLVVRELPEAWQGSMQSNLARIVGGFVHRHSLGLVGGQDTGFRIRSDPDTVRGADLAFVAADRAASSHVEDMRRPRRTSWPTSSHRLSAGEACGPTSSAAVYASRLPGRCVPCAMPSP